MSAPLPWFKIHPGDLLTGRGVARALGDDLGAGALMRFLLYSHQHGSVRESELEAVCGPGAAALRPCLEVDAGGNLVLPYLERMRREAEEFRSTRAAAGRASANKRQHKSTRVQHKRTHVNQDSTVQNSTEEPENKPTRAGARGGSGTPLTQWWDAEFERTRGVPYRWVRTGKDGKGCPDAVALGGLQKQGFPPDEIRERITVFLERGLANGDTWEFQNATPRLFASRYATLGTQVKKLNKADAQVAEILRQTAEPARDLWSQTP